MHPAAKQMGVNVDSFSYGTESLGLLLWWGDLAAARVGIAKVVPTT